MREHASLEGSPSQRPFEARRLCRLAPQGDGKGCLRAPSSFRFVIEKDMTDRPYCLIGAGYAELPIPILRSLEGSGAPADAEGCEPSDERRARPLNGTLARRPLAPLGTRRLPALHSGVLRLTGRAFENVDQPRLSASSWRQVLMPASGAPPSPGCLGARFPEARGAASADGGVSPPGRPGEFVAVSPARFSSLLRLHGVP